MAVCSTIFSMTGDFQVVFLANAAFTLFVMITAWLTIDRQTREMNSEAQGK
jgi:hypothetical protein